MMLIRGGHVNDASRVREYFRINKGAKTFLFTAISSLFFRNVSFQFRNVPLTWFMKRSGGTRSELDIFK